MVLGENIGENRWLLVGEIGWRERDGDRSIIGEVEMGGEDIGEGDGAMRHYTNGLIGRLYFYPPPCSQTKKEEELRG